MSVTTATTIRIKVPNQEFEAILLMVGPATTMGQVKREVACQLYHNTKSISSYTIRAMPFGDNTEPVYYFPEWTIFQIIDQGAKEFEFVQ